MFWFRPGLELIQSEWKKMYLFAQREEDNEIWKNHEETEWWQREKRFSKVNEALINQYTSAFL